MTAWLCPFCAKKIARSKTPRHSAKGLLIMHTKAKHKLFYPICRPETAVGLIEKHAFKTKGRVHF